MLWLKSLDNWCCAGACLLPATIKQREEVTGARGALQTQGLQPQVLPQIGLNFVLNGKTWFLLILCPHVLMGLLSLHSNAAAVQQSPEQPVKGTSTHLVQGASGDEGAAGNAW